MKRLFKFTATLALCLITSGAMAAEGINSTGGNPLPIGAGGDTFIRILHNSGRINFFNPRSATETAWIEPSNGTASFARVTTTGNVEASRLIIGSQGASNNVTVNNNKIWTNSGNLYLNDETTGDSIIHVGAPSKTTSVYIPQGVVQIGSEVIDEATVKIANTLKSCQPDETVVKDANHNYICRSFPVANKTCPSARVVIGCQRGSSNSGCGAVAETITVSETSTNQNFSTYKGASWGCGIGYQLEAVCQADQTWAVGSWDCDQGGSNSNNHTVTNKYFEGFGLALSK